MTPVQQSAPPSRHPGAEPVPGYRLLEPLGQGGFGEVWKCEAPGGVFKAIKFVGNKENGESPARQELEALQRVKTLRHPFILSLDRLEESEDGLLIIMELADQNLHDLWQQYRHDGEAGVPREELIDYLLEAAEALDWMNFQHGLQHLDVKPHNLFLVSNHVKVADFGLVSSLGDERNGQSPTRQGGVTPLYSAPELLRGTLSRNSDQYSLAVVYQQLLTGTVPFWHDNVYELMMQHLSASPDLAALPEQDRPVISRALAKVPQQRYASCMEFLQALLGVPKSTGVRKSGAWRRVLLGPRVEEPAPPIAPSRNSVSDQPSQIAPSAETPDPGGTRRPSTTPNWERTRQSHEQTPTRKLRSLGLAARRNEESLSAATGAASEYPVPVAQPAPTAVSITGYRFLACLNQGPFGDLWRAEDSEGHPKRAMCVLNFVQYDARLIAHLQALRDPALPNTEVHWSPAERLVVLTDAHEKTLRERFDESRVAGKPGIPRAELLPLLRSAAEALDALDARHGLPHLGVNPRNLLIDGTRLWVCEFGLIPLVWLPTGQSAAVLNGRYAAPELFDRRPSRTADQYSLALIYAEMLTGIHPRPPRTGSGMLRRPGKSGSRSSTTVRTIRTDVDLLPASDREVILKALSTDPEKRFESCTAFVEALEQAGQLPNEPDLYDSLPPVIPFASLMGEPAPPDTILPCMGDFISSLTIPDPRSICGPQNARYFVQRDGSWEYRFPLQLFPGAMKLKIDGLRDHWRARLLSQHGDAYRLQIDIDEVRPTFRERGKKPTRQLVIDVRVDPPIGSETRMTEATVLVRCFGGDDRAQNERVLTTMAPRVFDSVRLYFQATQEQRIRGRLPLTQPIRIYPILPDLEFGELIEGTCHNVSQGGIGFQVPKRPESDVLYLHLYASPQALAYAVLAKVARVLETGAGIEIGAMFPAART
jgi:serine/threonine protein kinase